MSKENSYCYCTNKTISELLNITITQVSRLANSLKDKNYINIELIYKENSKQVEMRNLIPIQKYLDTYLQKVQYLPNKNVITNTDENVSFLDINLHFYFIYFSITPFNGKFSQKYRQLKKNMIY